jgi:Tol biopolymer transport system component
MKARSSSALIGLAGLLAGTLGFFGAVPARAQSTPTLTGTSVTINDGLGNSTDPHVSGDWVSYTNNGTGLLGIDYYNLATAQSGSIDNDGGNDELSGISGTTIVYTHEDTSGNYSIDAFDIGSGNPPAALDPQSGSVRLTPAIGGDTVAWVDYTANPATPVIMADDLATGTVTQLGNPNVPNLEPAVSPDGSVITWVECEASGAPCDVWDAILGSDGTWTTNQLTDGASSDVDSEQPHTNGTIVVYSSLRSGIQGIYWQPVGGGAEQEAPFPAGGGTSSDAHVSGDLISFENLSSAGQSNIFVYSLATQTLYQVTNTPGVNAELDDISVTPGGAASVVWEALVSGQYNVYGFTFQAPPLTVTTTSLPDAGYGQPYSQTLATSGTGPDTWAVTGGALPAGLTLDPASGTISGTPTAAGPSAFTVSATDTGSPAQTATQQLTLSVDPAPLTAEVAGSQTYGGSPVFTVTGFTGLVNEDTAAVVTGSLTGCVTSLGAGAAPGTYSGTISGCSGLSSPNYAISYADAGVTVSPAPLTITASSPSMTYGAVPPTITPAYTGFANGDTDLSLATAPTCTTTATAASPVGTYPSSCTGAADPDYTISYNAGTVTVGQAGTSLAYTGPESIAVGTSLVPAATLSSPAAACEASQPVTFSLSANPANGTAGTYTLESATTISGGTATGASVSTSGWLAGAYTITASYPGTANCSASTTAEPLVVTTSGLAAAGAGTYSVTGTGQVGFGFIVARIPHTSFYLGDLSLISNGSWRLTGTMNTYALSSSTQGMVTGTGSLYWWNPALNNNRGGWQLAKAGVAFTASFAATTSTSPGSFGIQITYTPVSPQPPALPNSSPVSLKAGAVVMT